jgi:hypothetical protein
MEKTENAGHSNVSIHNKRENVVEGHGTEDVQSYVLPSFSTCAFKALNFWQAYAVALSVLVTEWMLITIFHPIIISHYNKL